MSDRSPDAPADAADSKAAAIRRRLHDANGHLSNAVMQLALILEDPDLTPSRRHEVELALESCRTAAEALRSVWPLVPRG
jgi:hypothetical protein